MTLQKSLFVQNCVIFLLEKKHGKNPESLQPQLINATPSFISIGTIPDADGAATIALTDQKDWPKAHPDMKVMFDGTIETPGRSLQVCTVLWEEVFNVSVREPRTNVQILTNDDYVPDKICFILK